MVRSGVTDFVLKAMCACVSAKREYGLPENENIGTVQHFRLSRLQKCCTVPIFGLSGNEKIRDSTTLPPLDTAEVLYCPYFLPAGTKKVPYCP